MYTRQTVKLKPGRFRVFTLTTPLGEPCTLWFALVIVQVIIILSTVTVVFGAVVS